MGTDLARRALARPDSHTLTLAPRVARSPARFGYAGAFNQPLNSWNTSKVTTMYYMWVLTSPAVRSLAVRSLTPTLAPRVARQVRPRHCLQPGPQRLGREQRGVLHCLLQGRWLQPDLEDPVVPKVREA